MEKQPGVDPYHTGYDQQQPVSTGNVNVTVQQPGGYPPAYPGTAPAGNTTVVMMQTSPVPIQSFVGHIALSCVVFWCCGWVFGLIGFILALVGQDRANTGDREGARALGRASYGVSIAGLLVGIAIWIYVVVYFTVLVNKTVNDLNNDGY